MSVLQRLDPAIRMDTLIPHRPPMQLIDRVIAAGTSRLLASAELGAGAPFRSDLGVPACIGLEYLGQSAAAFFSVQALVSVQRGSGDNDDITSPRPGMLIASRNYRCCEGYFPPETHLLIDLALNSTVSNSGLVKFSGAIHSVNPASAARSALLDTRSDGLITLCDFLQDATPFAEGDLSVYLPPADHSAETQ